MLKRKESSPESSSITLKAEGLSKHYRMGDVEVPALKKIHLSVSPGDLCAIAGHSGSGKTTLLNLLGLLDEPSEGRIFLGGIDTAALSPNSRARLRAEKLGFIFQNFNLLPVLTAFENIEYPLLILGVPPKERARRVEEALDRVGLGRHASHRPAQLSGGQRQRVAIARAIVKSPWMVLADEPTASLDKGNAQSILELLRDLNRDLGTAFVFSSHDPTILAFAQRVLLLSDGREVPFTGRPHAV